MQLHAPGHAEVVIELIRGSLDYYGSIAEALDTCNEWYMMNRLEPKYQVNIQADDIELLCDSSATI